MNVKEIVTKTPIKFPVLCAFCEMPGNIDMVLHSHYDRSSGSVVELAIPHIMTGAIILAGKPIAVKSCEDCNHVVRFWKCISACILILGFILLFFPFFMLIDDRNDMLMVIQMVLSIAFMVGSFISYRIAKERMSKVRIYYQAGYFRYLFQDHRIYHEGLSSMNISDTEGRNEGCKD